MPQVSKYAKNYFMAHSDASLGQVDSHKWLQIFENLSRYLSNLIFNVHNDQPILLQHWKLTANTVLIFMTKVNLKYFLQFLHANT